MNTEKRYPRRGEHGDPIPSCEWCGDRVLIARMWREYGTYCSAECRAADRHGFYAGSVVIASIFLAISLGALSFGHPFLPVMMILIFSSLWLLYSINMTNLGSRVIQSQSEPINKDELDEICSIIIDIVQANQTTKGVSRKVLYADLRSYGYNNRTIKSGINHLLISEKLRQISLSRYVADS